MKIHSVPYLLLDCITCGACSPATLAQISVIERRPFLHTTSQHNNRYGIVRHSGFSEVIAVFLLVFQIFDLIAGMLLIYLIFYYLFQRKPNIASIRAVLQGITAKRVLTFLLAVLGAITVIVPFMQFLISMIVGKQ
jgi:hypothetical protein